MDDNFERYEQMDPEDRLYEARSKVFRIVVMRVAIAALLVWVIFRSDLPVAMIALLVGVIVVILGTLVPVLAALKTTLKEPEEESE